MNRKLLLFFGVALVAVMATTFVVSDLAYAGPLDDAIAKTPQGTGPGQIDPKAQPGFMGIPGGPQVFWLWGILWGIWVGWIFSSVGAFGGIMAGVGHISVFG
ncbi:MAG: sulfite exporter TauE/SafE family protein, partial [Syntrophaceae bacterium]|nr:sulfite exporter TauE/SafE family protein [Syntrophaceae bacterium]